MLTRRRFVTALATSALAPTVSFAQPADKVYRIGYMSIPSRESAKDLMDGVFLPALRERGLVDGKNLLIEWRWADGHPEQLAGFAAELVALKVDLIVAPQSDSALAAKRATRTIPIVHVLAGDAVADGLVTSLAHPGGNVTGLTTTPSPEIMAKSLEMLKESTGASRIAAIWNPARNYPTIELGLRRVRAAAQALKLQLQVVEITGPEQLDRAYAAMAQWRAQAILMIPDSMFWQHRRRFAELESKHRLPTMYDKTEFAEAGGLMAYGVELASLFRRAPVFIDKILKGAKPADLPVEQPTTFALLVNQKAARALGLRIPQSILLQATRVIE